VYEYKVIPAPCKGQKVKGIKTPEDRFANTLEEILNAEAAQGWEFTRAETLPSEERSGFRATKVVYRSVLVFRRAIVAAAAATPDYPTAPAVSAPADEAPLDETPQDSSSANA